MDILLFYIMVGISVAREIEMIPNMRIFSARYFSTHISPNVWHPKEQPDPMNGLNYGQNYYLIKVKLIIDPDPFAYYILP